MPARVWSTPGFVSWVPSGDGMADGTVVRLHAVGAGANGGNFDGMGGGGAGGGGERRSEEITIAESSDTYSVFVASGGSGDQTYVEYSAMYQVRAVPGGNAFGQSGGAGGTGGTGSLIEKAGGNGGAGGATSGGGGGSAGGDNAIGNNGDDSGSGGTGGPGITQFGVLNSGGGGNGGVVTGDGTAGDLWGSGGGGGSAIGNGGAGRHGIVIACWGAMLETYPTDFSEGFQPDPEQGGPSASSAWMLLLGD